MKASILSITSYSIDGNIFKMAVGVSTMVFPEPSSLFLLASATLFLACEYETIRLAHSKAMNSNRGAGRLRSGQSVVAPSKCGITFDAYESRIARAFWYRQLWKGQDSETFSKIAFVSNWGSNDLSLFPN